MVACICCLLGHSVMVLVCFSGSDGPCWDWVVLRRRGVGLRERLVFGENIQDACRAKKVGNA